MDGQYEKLKRERLILIKQYLKRKLEKEKSSLPSPVFAKKDAIKANSMKKTSQRFSQKTYE